MKSTALLAVAGLACLAGTACNIQVGKNGDFATTGEIVRENRSIPLAKAAKAEMVQVDLQMGAGTLNLEGGAKELFEGDFEYNIARWKPIIEYNDSGFRGRLTVKQGNGSGTFGEAKNEWRLKLSNTVPMDLKIQVGAGENTLDLRELNLRSVELHLGAGKVDMDLRSTPKRDMDVRIQGGVGEAKVRVSKDVGVEAEASGGLGEVDVRGMHKDGSRWTNEAYGKSKSTIRLNVKGGIGKIEIVSE